MSANDPNQWLGLLRWSLQYQDGTREAEAKEMDADERQWLEEAMSSMVVDEAKRMAEIVDRLAELRTSEAGAVKDEIDVLFEELQDMVEQIDQAFNLHKIGKLVTIIDMLRYENPVFRSHAAGIIATCSQNNPKVQKVAIEAGALAYTAHLFVHDTNVDVRVKALWALSCLVRNYTPGENLFAQNEGIYMVCRGVRDEDNRIQTKAVWFLSYLLTRDSALRTDDVVNIYGLKIQETGLCNDLVQLVGHEHVNLNEGALQVLQKLLVITGPRDVLLQAGISEKLAARIAEIGNLTGEDKEDAQTELDMLTMLSSC